MTAAARTASVRAPAIRARDLVEITRTVAAHGACSSRGNARSTLVQDMAIPSAQVTIPVTNQPMRRLTRAEYDKLVSQGWFHGERVELIFGQVVAMSPTDPSHVESTYRIHQRLLLALTNRAKVLCQSPIAATDDSEPEPDVYVTPLGDRWAEHASRAHLVVEVSRSSLAYDRGEKALLYGIAEVDEYWIVDLVHGLVEVRRDRESGEWRSIVTYRRGQTIALLAFPDVTIDVSEILPPL
jgi:Uma2 family endonuclease